MALTPILLIPYPVSTDKVIDGENAMQAIAEKIDGMSSGWATVATFLNGWHSYGSGLVPARYRKLHGVVYLQGFLQGGTLTTGTPMFTLPAGFRPSYDLGNIPARSNNVAVDFQVNATGNVICGSGIAAQWLAIYAAYPAEL